MPSAIERFGMSFADTNVPMDKLDKFHECDVTDQVFDTSPLCFAFGNIEPLLSGSILIAPQRRVARLPGLTDDEAAELFITVKRVTKMLELVYRTTAFNLPTQHGIDADQSVPHVCVHISPRIDGGSYHSGGSKAIYEEPEGDQRISGGRLI